MKYRSSTIAAAAATIFGSSAIMNIQTTTQAWTTSSLAFHRHYHQQQDSKRRRQLQQHSTSIIRTSTALGSTIEDAPVVSAPKSYSVGTTSDGKTVIAQGSIVSRFRGGLTAIRIVDGDDGGKEGSSGSVVGLSTPSGTASKTASSSSIGGDLLGHQVVFPDGSSGVVVVHRPPVIFVYSEQRGKEATNRLTTQEIGGVVTVLNQMTSISVLKKASIVDWSGRSVQLPEEEEEEDREEGLLSQRAMFAPIPTVSEIALIDNPMLSGITMFDSLAPVGRGQNMLMIGHDLTTMRGYVCDFIASQIDQQTKVVYASTENNGDAMDQLKSAGVLNNIHFVTTTTATNTKTESLDQDEVCSEAAKAVSVAATACAIGEFYALEEGKHSFVIIDTIDQHKKLWDATTHVLVDIFGVEAVVAGDREGSASSEMRAYYSSLIQRSAQYNKRKGGGSVTLLLLTTVPRLRDADDVANENELVFSESDFEQCSDKIRDRIQLLVKRGVALSAANLRKIDIPIPSVAEGKRRLVLQHIDDLISMSDGQIWLDETLEEKGQRPPMDPQRSITRIGIGADTESQADAPALRRLVQGLRLEISQAFDMVEGAEVTNASAKQRNKTNALLLAMHHEPGQGKRRLSQSCTVLLAASKGYLDDTVQSGALAGTAEGRRVIHDLLEHVAMLSPQAMEDIDETLDLTSEAEKKITDSIISFFSSETIVKNDG